MNLQTQSRTLNRGKFSYIVPHEAALAAALLGQTYAQIGAKYGVSASAICQMLSKDRLAIEGYLVYRKHKDLFMEFLQFRILSNLNLSANSLRGYTGVVAAGILEDKIRLIRGQSTGLIDLRAIHMSLTEITQRKELIHKEIEFIRSRITTTLPNPPPDADITPSTPQAGKDLLFTDIDIES